MAFHWPMIGYNKPFHWLDINSFMPEHDLHFIILWNSKNLGSLCDHGKKRKLNTGTNNEGLKGTLDSSLQMRQKKTSLEKLLFKEAIFVKLRLKDVVKIH